MFVGEIAHAIGRRILIRETWEIQENRVRFANAGMRVLFRDVAQDERPTANDELHRGDVLWIALVLKFAEEFFLLQGTAATQEFKQRVFHVPGRILSAFVDGLKLPEVGD